MASILSEQLEGEAIETVAQVDGYITDTLDDRFPAIRRDCVVGPEKVIREGAREYVESTH